MHTGEPLVGGERYVGMGVNRGARICSAAHGGQVLLSNTTRELVEDDLPGDVRIVDLGEHQLKDLPRPERIFQLLIDGLQPSFPALRTGEAPKLVEGRERKLARAAAAAFQSRRTRRAWLLGLAAIVVMVAVDFAVSGWSFQSPDPSYPLGVFDGRTIGLQSNSDFSYFQSPKFNAQLDTASKLSGPRRYRTYDKLALELERDYAPVAPIATATSRDFTRSSTREQRLRESCALSGFFLARCRRSFRGFVSSLVSFQKPR
jgi:hypothetical protein